MLATLTMIASERLLALSYFDGYMGMSTREPRAHPTIFVRVTLDRGSKHSPAQDWGFLFKRNWSRYTHWPWKYTHYLQKRKLSTPSMLILISLVKSPREEWQQLLKIDAVTFMQLCSLGLQIAIRMFLMVGPR